MINSKREIEQLQVYINKLKSFLIKGVDVALEEIEKTLKNESRKYDDFILLKSQYGKIRKDLLYGISSNEISNLAINKIRLSIIELINSLEIEDLNISQANTSKKHPKTGKILYNIPSQMQVRKRYKCQIRIAYKDIDLKVNWKATQAKEIEIRIAKVMFIDILDDSNSQKFVIEPITNQEQILDEDIFTEWIFSVTPMSVGTHTLLLKVSTIEIIEGKERRKDSVLEQPIEILTENTRNESETQFKESELIINLVDTNFQSNSKLIQSFGGLISNLKRGTKIVLLLSTLLLITFTFSFSQIVDAYYWHQAKKIGTKEAFEKYLVRRPNSVYKIQAEDKLESIEKRNWLDTKALNLIESYNTYLKDYSNGLFVREADSLLRVLEDSIKAMKNIKIENANSDKEKRNNVTDKNEPNPKGNNIYQIENNNINENEIEELKKLIGKVDKEQEIKISANIAYFYQQNKQYDEAIIWFNKGIEKSEKFKINKYLPSIYSDLGRLYYGLNNYEESIVCYEKTLSMLYSSSGSGSDNIIQTLINISDINLKQENLKKAKERLLEGIRYLNKNDKNTFLLGILFFKVSEISMLQSDFEKSLSYVEKSINYFESLGRNSGLYLEKARKLKIKIKEKMN